VSRDNPLWGYGVRRAEAGARMGLDEYFPSIKNGNGRFRCCFWRGPWGSKQPLSRHAASGLALITNGAGEPQRAKIVSFALKHRFDHIQIEGEHGFVSAFPGRVTGSACMRHRPFRGLLCVHSRCGLHTRAVTVIGDLLPKGFNPDSPNDTAFCGELAMIMV
jgi:hypothetical protein